MICSKCGTFLMMHIWPCEGSMRADLERIKKMIEDLDSSHAMDLSRMREDVFRELLTTWQALNSHEYQSDVKLHLNMLTKRMLNGD